MERQATPDSPCVRNCCLDEQNICVGCGRTLEDIRHWSSLEGVEREQRLAEAQARVEGFRRRWGAW